MVEVFKTNVIDAIAAQEIIDQIHENFAHYEANFALDDCDKILRIKSPEPGIAATEIIAIVETHGFAASILADDFQPSAGLSFIF
jgi:hypothetical protein